MIGQAPMLALGLFAMRLLTKIERLQTRLLFVVGGSSGVFFRVSQVGDIVGQIGRGEEGKEESVVCNSSHKTPTRRWGENGGNLG